MNGPFRALLTARVAFGAGLLAAPGTLLRWAGGRSDARARRVARILGLRDASQAVLLSARPSRAWLRIAATVDLTHATTMVLLASLRTNQRGPAAVSAVISGSCALAELVEANDRIA